MGALTYPLPGAARPHAPTDANGQAMTYDANGNLLAGRGRTITWNARNLPMQVGDTVYAYDGNGARLKKITPASTSLYPVGDDHEVTNGTVTKYANLPGLGLAAKRTGSATYWLHADRLGSMQAITDASGSVVQERTYRPYGEKIADTTSHEESRGYIGERQDADTGLSYLHARYYDATLGLSLSADPTSPVEPGVGPARYLYSLGNPIALRDPTGLKANCAFNFLGYSVNTIASTYFAGQYRGSTIYLTANWSYACTDFDPGNWRIDELRDSLSGGSNLGSSNGNTIDDGPSLLEEVVMFLTGAGPKNVHNGPNSQQAKDMKDAPGMDVAREQFKQQGCADVTGLRGTFGIWNGAGPGESVPFPFLDGAWAWGHDGQFESGSKLRPNFSLLHHPTRQVLGSYSIDITNTDPGQVQVDLHNTMSLNSLLGHLAPNVPKPFPYGNMDIKISWTEASPCR